MNVKRRKPIFAFCRIDRKREVYTHANEKLEFEYDGIRIKPINDTRYFIAKLVEKHNRSLKMRQIWKRTIKRYAHANKWVNSYMLKHGIESSEFFIENLEIIRIFDSETNIIEFTAKNYNDYYYMGITPLKELWFYRISPNMVFWTRENILKRILDVDDLTDFVEQ